MSTRHTVLLVENDEQSAEDIKRFLKVKEASFIISVVPDISHALSFLEKQPTAIILLSESMLGDRQFESFKQITVSESIPVILLGQAETTDLERKVKESGAVEVMEKSKINFFHLSKVIESVLKLNRTVQQFDREQRVSLSQHNTYQQLLERLNVGVMIISSDNSVSFANELSFATISDVNYRDFFVANLRYRAIVTEEKLEWKAANNTLLIVRVSNLEWNGESANLYLIETEEIEVVEEPLKDKMFQAVIHSINENVWLLRDDKIEVANSASERFTKWTSKQLAGRKWVDLIKSGHTTGVSLTLTSFFDDKEASGEMSLPDGSAIPIIYFIKPISLAGKYYRILSFKTAPDRESQSIPKERSAESEMFSTEGVLHLASHDLREPVRTILNYAQLISDNIGAQKYEQAIEFAGLAKTAAAGMDKLLSDLKTYISLTDHALAISKVSMKQIAAEVVRSMKKRIEETGAEVSIGELPEVYADRQLVEKLLTHLIDNAIKFQRKDKRPVIDVGYDRFEGSIIFCVRDNGIGISKKYYQKVFDVFERLNRVEEYPGNGLGLAICKKVVEMHSGQIWVESLPGSGSNFYFTLSNKPVQGN